MSVIPKNQVTVVPVQLNGINEKVSEYNADASAVLSECDNFQVRYDGLLEPRRGYVSLAEQSSTYSASYYTSLQPRRVLSRATGLSIAGSTGDFEYTQYNKVKNSLDNEGYTDRKDYRLPFLDPELLRILRPARNAQFGQDVYTGPTPDERVLTGVNYFGEDEILSDCHSYEYCSFETGTSGSTTRPITMVAFVNRSLGSPIADSDLTVENDECASLIIYVIDNSTGEVVARCVRDLPQENKSVCQIKAFAAGSRGLIAISGFSNTSVPFCRIYQIELSSITDIYKGVMGTTITIPMNTYKLSSSVSMIDACTQLNDTTGGTLSAQGYLATQSDASDALGILYTFQQNVVNPTTTAITTWTYSTTFPMGKSAGALDRISGLGVSADCWNVLVAADIDGACVCYEYVNNNPAYSGKNWTIGASYPEVYSFTCLLGNLSKAYLIGKKQTRTFVSGYGDYDFVVCANNTKFNDVVGDNSAIAHCKSNGTGASSITSVKDYQDIHFTSKPFWCPIPGGNAADKETDTTSSSMTGIRCVVTGDLVSPMVMASQESASVLATSGVSQNIGFREYVIDISEQNALNPVTHASIYQLPVIATIAAAQSMACGREYCQRNMIYSDASKSVMGVFDVALSTLPRTYDSLRWQKVTQFAVYRLDTQSKYLYGSTFFEGSSFTSGGQICVSSGGMPVEAGFPSPPGKPFIVNRAAGTMDAGTYSYICIFEWTDGDGNTYQSEASSPTSVTQAGSRYNVVTIPRPSLGKMFQMHNPVRCNFYRSSATNSTYKWIGAVCVPSYGKFVAGGPELKGWYKHFAIIDNATEAQIANGEQPYYQPGLSSQPLPRQCPGTIKSITTHKDRLFGIDDLGNVRFTGPKVFGEGFWWSDAFQITVAGGQGKPTALASFESKIIVFKRDSVFAIYGDGPPENGGNGTEYSPPEKISEGIGCIDPRSVTVTPIGVFFRSIRGIELLASGGKVVFIGESVQRTTSFDGSYPYTLSAMYDPVTDCVKFLLSSNSFPIPSGTYTQTILCFYIKSNSWTTHTPKKASGSTHTMLDIARARIDGYDRTVIVTPTAILAERCASPYYLNDDDSTSVISTYTTSWLKMNNTPTSQMRCWGYESQGIHMDSHQTTMTCYYNYSGTAGNSSTFTTTSINSSNASPVTPETLDLQPAKENVQAIKVKVTCQAFSDGTNTNSGNGTCKFFGGGFSIGQKPGLPKIPAVQS